MTYWLVEETEFDINKEGQTLTTPIEPIFKIEYSEIETDRHLLHDLPGSTIFLIVCFIGSIILITIVVCIACAKMGKRWSSFFEELQGAGSDHLAAEDSE